MPFAERAARVYNMTLGLRAAVPLIRGWNRLEARPRSEDFARSLRAEVRDPLWFLTRQWQYGEFEGEDAGSPIDARVAYRTSRLDRYAVANAVFAYDVATPLEVRVEREVVPFDLMLHMQAAQVFERLLANRGSAERLSDYVRLFALDFDHGVAGAATAESRALFETGREFLFDTAQLLASVRDGSHATRLTGIANLTAAERAKLVDAGNALLEWYSRTYPQPAGEPTAWRAETLGYAFGCTASQAAIRLDASNHRGGELDWYAFDAAPADVPSPPSETAATTLSFLPAAIRFAGAPSQRHWEIEGTKTDFGRLDVNTNDLARLLLAEFMLLFSNDWCLLPLELEVGSFTRIEGIVVTDVFGDRTLLRAADRGADADWQRWSMYRLHGDDNASMGLLLAPALTARMEAPPVEEVHFLRDEMANLVWAVEHRLASKIGEPLDPSIRYVQTATSESPTPGVARYLLGATVPPNWRPFIPAHVPGSQRAIRLQRARMPDQPHEPLGRVLDVPSPYFVAEEEVPRAGRKVTRAFQRARWIDGATFLWIGRAAPFGRGEGSSGLVFDAVEETREGGVNHP